jgi:hypothetical protein
MSDRARGMKVLLRLAPLLGVGLLAYLLIAVRLIALVVDAIALGLRLISEAIGQSGFVGMLGGEAARVSLLGSGASVAGAICSVALNRTLFILAGALI